MLNNKKISFFLRVFVGIGIILILFKFIPYQKLIVILKQADSLFIILSFAITLFINFIGVFRWRFLLNSLGIPATFKEAVFLSFSGYFFNLFFPSFIAGDAFRGVALGNKHANYKRVFSSVVMDRFSGALALIIIAVFFYIFNFRLFKDNPNVLFVLLLLLLTALLASAIIFSKTVFNFTLKVLRKKSALRDKIVNFHDELYFFKENPLVFFKSILFSLVIQLILPLAFFVLSKAFNLKINVFYFLVLIPVIMAIAFIPITISGLGTREAAAVYFFSKAGISKEVALGMSLISFIFIVIIGLIGGLMYVMVYNRWLQRHSQN